MRTRIVVLLAVAASVALALVVANTAFGSQTGREINLYAVDGYLEVRDLDGSGSTFEPTSGDIHVFGNDWAPRPGGRVVARTEGGFCQWVGRGTFFDLEVQCSRAVVLPEGKIHMVASGQADEAVLPGYVLDWAIVGGTGAFRNVRGEAKEVLPNDPDGQPTLTISLIGG